MAWSLTIVHQKLWLCNSFPLCVCVGVFNLPRGRHSYSPSWSWQLSVVGLQLVLWHWIRPPLWHIHSCLQPSKYQLSPTWQTNSVIIHTITKKVIETSLFMLHCLNSGMDVVCFHLQGDKFHWAPYSHSLSETHTCHCWGWSLGYTYNPPHTHPHSQEVRPHPDTFLDMNSHTESRSCWEGRPGLEGAREGGVDDGQIKGWIQRGRHRKQE